MWNKQYLQISTGYRVDADKWEGTRCRNNTFHGNLHIHASVINKKIDIIIQKISDIFYSFEQRDIIPTKKELHRELFDEKSNKQEFQRAWIDYIGEGVKLKQWSDNTVKSIRQVQQLLLSKLPELSFSDIDVETLNQFVYQQQEKMLSNAKFGHGQQGYANNVIAKNCRILKQFLRWCADKHLLNYSIVNQWKPTLKTIDKPVIFLDWEELMSVYRLDLDYNKRQREVRDIFCFMCFTSLRYSDVMRLNPKNIINDKIVIRTKKTNTNIEINLNKYSKSIFEKYKEGDSERLFPYYSNANMNEILKVIGEKANLNSEITISQFYGNRLIERTVFKYQILSSHCARRTFVCNALALGIPAHVVMKWTGHKELTSMKPYIDVADKIKRDEMDKFNSI